MSELTLIGLGAMGSAIARTLIDKKYDMTVWNRSPEKVETLVELGASSAQSLKQAIESSQIILFCIHGYAATRTLLDDPEIIALLPGRIVIQMSTGTSAEARAAELGINTELPDFVLGLYHRAAAAGYIKQDNSALIKVFRGVS